MKFQKKHVISAALALALGAAVYINWQVNSTKQPPAKELGAASYVNATVTATVDEAARTSSISKKQQDYFAAERVKRQTAQDAVLDRAQELFDLENTSESDKSDAQRSVETILKRFTIQDSIESIVKAKGFSDCLCCISDEGVTLIVPKEQLTETAALVLDDAVTSHYNVSYENITRVGA